MAQKRTWLDGPEIPGQNDYDAPGKWPGEKLGLPEKGSGALASVGRRAMGVLIDWLLCLLLASAVVRFTDAFGGTSTATFLFWVFLGIISGWLFARTPGMAVLGMGVARVDAPGSTVGLWRAVLRTVFTSLIFPAAMVDADGRGMHDRATGTAVIRS